MKITNIYILKVTLKHKYISSSCLNAGRNFHNNKSDEKAFCA